MTNPRKIRNIAIIAHVDHGKTTLVDALLQQTGEFKVKADEAQECVLDSNPQERERGITILAKCTSVNYKGTRINIVDTPGHADFGGEVERILKMVDGALLLVDAYDGPMPQTRFVLRKALEAGLHPIVVINKVDRQFADPHKALDATFALFINLGASDHQLDFPIIYASGKNGWASKEVDKPTTTLEPLFDAIVSHVPAPAATQDKPLQMQVTMLDYNSYVGRMGIGRITNGKMTQGQSLVLLKPDGKSYTGRLTKLYGFFGLARQEVPEAEAGDIVALAGLEEVHVGDTIATADYPERLPVLTIDPPTLSMEVMVNDSPFAGRDGKFLTSRHLRARLEQEKQTNVGLQIEELGNQGIFKLSGRGELHLSVLIETMRREGFEMAVSRPEVIDQEKDGKAVEPAEDLVLEVEKQYQGAVMESIGKRGAEIKNMVAEGDTMMRIDCVITARALIGFKSELLTLTRGTGLMHHSFHGYVAKRPAPPRRLSGVLVAKETGVSTAYALDALQERATLFVAPVTDVYEGMIVGANSRDNDMVVNPCKKKALTNMRAAGSDDLILLTPPKVFSLEQAIEFIEGDELVEITPKNIRLRKKQLRFTVRRKTEHEEED